jgi:hypothetical protein
MLPSQETSALTVCHITNLGTKPVKLVNPRILDGTGAFAATFGNCADAPLAPSALCYFGGTGQLGVGGGAIDVKGSTKGIRGTCRLQHPKTGVILTVDAMR